MGVNALRCRGCGAEYPLDSLYSCTCCNGILEVQYDYGKKARDCLAYTGAGGGIWRFRDLLPILNEDNIISLGEGDTPLIRADNLNPAGSGCRVYLKLESLNPSGSFKDRPISVGVSKAREFGAEVVVVASSGNASASAAAYAARAGLRCLVCIPQSTDIGKVSQAIAHGAEVIYVEGTFSSSFEVVKQAAQHYGWPNMSTTFINPYTVEGDKTVAYEIFQQLNGTAPDAVIVPVGAGPLLVGMAKGFAELERFDLIEKMPRLIGVQSVHCAPIAEAYRNKSELVEPWLKPVDTIATGIADPLVGYEADGTLTLKTILQTGGSVISLVEDEISAACQRLNREVGVYAEPTAAAAIGALEQLIAEREIGENESVVCVITGHGLKYAHSSAYRPPVVSNFEELKALIKIELKRRSL